jgi:GNAT superfamily N-acetyltransferase
LSEALRIERFTAADYAPLAALLTAAGGEPVDPAVLRDQDAALPPKDALGRDDRGLLTGFARRRFLAWQGAHLVGTAVAWRAPWTRPGSLASDLAVVPGNPESEAIAASLLASLHSWGVAIGASEIMGVADDRQHDRLATLQDTGFRIDAHIVEGRLAASPGRQAAWQARLDSWRTGSPLRFTTLAGHDSESMRRQLHALYQRTLADNPGHVDTVPGYEQWVADALASRTDWVFLALDGTDISGVCAVVPSDEPGVAYVDYTGVDRPWRGQGVAGALKAYAALAVVEDGATSLVTEWDLRNIPIARANERFGFTVTNGHYRVIAPLG